MFGCSKGWCLTETVALQPKRIDHRVNQPTSLPANTSNTPSVTMYWCANNTHTSIEKDRHVICVRVRFSILHHTSMALSCLLTLACVLCLAPFGMLTFACVRASLCIFSVCLYPRCAGLQLFQHEKTINDCLNVQNRWTHTQAQILCCQLATNG